jgi:hypothetical protein
MAERSSVWTERSLEAQRTHFGPSSARLNSPKEVAALLYSEDPLDVPLRESLWAWQELAGQYEMTLWEFFNECVPPVGPLFRDQEIFCEKGAWLLGKGRTVVTRLGEGFYVTFSPAILSTEDHDASHVRVLSHAVRQSVEAHGMGWILSREEWESTSDKNLKEAQQILVDLLKAAYIEEQLAQGVVGGGSFSLKPGEARMHYQPWHNQVVVGMGEDTALGGFYFPDDNEIVQSEVFFSAMAPYWLSGGRVISESFVDIDPCDDWPFGSQLYVASHCDLSGKETVFAWFEERVEGVLNHVRRGPLSKIAASLIDNS